MSRWAPQPSPPCSVRELISAWMTLSAQVAFRCRLQQGWWETQLPCGAKDGRRRRATRAQARATSASAHRGWRVTCYDTPRAHRKRWLAWHVVSAERWVAPRRAHRMQRGARRRRRPARRNRIRPCTTCVLRAALHQAGEPAGQGYASQAQQRRTAEQRMQRKERRGRIPASSVRAHTLSDVAPHSGRVTRVAKPHGCGRQCVRLHRCSATSCRRGARAPRHAQAQRRTDTLVCCGAALRAARYALRGSRGHDSAALPSAPRRTCGDADTRPCAAHEQARTCAMFACSGKRGARRTEAE